MKRHLFHPLVLIVGMVLAFYATCLSANGVPSVIVESESKKLPLSESLEFLRDSDHKLDIADILENGRHLQWQRSEAPVPNLGMSSDTVWFRVSILNNSDGQIERWLELAYAKLDMVMMYFVRDGSIVEQQLLGDIHPFSMRPIAHRNFLTALTLPPNSKTTIVVRLRSSGALQMPLVLWDKAEFVERDQGNLSLQMMFAGLMIALGAYNLLLFIAIRDISYLWYVLNVFSIAMAQLSMTGVTSQYLWPNMPVLNNVSLIVFFAMNLTFGALFTYHFLQLPQRSRKLANLIMGVACWGGVLLVGCFLADYALIIKTLSISAAIVTPLILGVGIYLWRKGVALARIYTVAWSFLLLGHSIQALGKIGLLPHSTLSEYGPEIGTSIEALLLSFALAFRFNQERRQRIQAQERALQVQREANVALESRVEERTRELESANQRLQEITSIDGLTGTKNRRFLDQTLDLEWRRHQREISQLSLLMLDVDYFKSINDQYGHLCGDACLKHLADILGSGANRAADTLARFGGEEFALLMGQTTLEGASLVAERLRKAVAAAPVIWEGQEIRMTISVGVAATVPAKPSDARELIAHADAALYQAKANGRNRVEVWDQSKN